MVGHSNSIIYLWSSKPPEGKGSNAIALNWKASKKTDIHAEIPFYHKWNKELKHFWLTKSKPVKVAVK